jgi:hypothetical protein
MKNGYIIKYYYDFLDDTKKQIYIDKKINFSKTDIELCNKYSEDCNYIINEILTNNIYKESIIIGFESVGFDKIMVTNISTKLKEIGNKLVLSIYDPHAFYQIWNLDKIKEDEKYLYDAQYHIFKDERVDNADIILTSSAKYFFNINSIYKNKCYSIPFSYNENYKLLFTVQCFDKYMNRHRKILLSGSIGSYKYRKILYYTRCDHEYVKNDIVIKNNLKSFKNLIEYMPYEKYDRYNTKYDELRGMRYINKLSKYMAAFICFGYHPIDFPLAKILEIFLSGALAIIEPKDFLLNEYGLVAFEHYIPLLLDNKNKLVIDYEYYNKYLGTEEGLRIAINGYEHIKNNFTDSKIALKYIDIIKNI